MQETVLLVPGQKIVLQLEGQGYKEFTYGELQTRLSGSPKPRGSKRSKTLAAKASRSICLMVRAILTGTWSTGARISVENVYDKLIRLIDELPDDALATLSEKAKSAIEEVIVLDYTQGSTTLRAFQRQLHLAYNRDVAR